MGYAIGIDLGTTNSAACVYRRGRSEIIPVENSRLMPSAISILPDGNALVGIAAKNRAIISPESSVTSAKRFIGDQKTKWVIMGKAYTPVEVSAMVLKQLKTASEAHLGGSVTDAVITVPAYFNNNQKQDTKKAAELAGFHVLQLLQEPTAAAISYGLDKGKDQTLVVYDLGGGTFDVSVLKIEGNRFTVDAVDGDFNLGGDDFDLLIVDHLLDILQEKTKKNMGRLRQLFRKKRTEIIEKDLMTAKLQLKELAEKAKKDLSQTNPARIQIPSILGTSLDEKISRDQFNRMIEPLVEKTIGKISSVIAAANLDKDDIDRVVLVGGSTRNKLVKKAVTRALKEPYAAERIDEAVAEGAAIMANYLSMPDEDNRPDIVVIPTTPFGLGVCSYEREGRARYINSIIIDKDSQVPCKESRPYEVAAPNQNDNILEVYMLQGESQDPAECLVLGKYVFSGINQRVGGGMTLVDIEYGYDGDGIISVSARERGSNIDLPLSIEPLPEDLSWLYEPPKGGQFDPSSLNIIATPKGYDDVGSVLRSLGLEFSEYDIGQSLDGCDIFFWNCLADEHPNKNEISQFVKNGGCLYASCCAANYLKDAFPGAINFDNSGCRSLTITAHVKDPELKKELGSNLRIEYNAADCYAITHLGPGSQILLEERPGKNVMVMVPYGQGHIFYTSFHHHSRLSKKEKRLLEMLVMKQVSTVSGIPIEFIQDSLS